MTAARWHTQPGALERVLSDLIVEEYARLRPGASPPPPLPWPSGIALGAGGLDLDSLEHYTVCAVIAAQFDLHDTEGVEQIPQATRFGELCERVARTLEEAGGRMVFRTSGSTGTPKSCVHPLALLEEEADALARYIGPRSRVLRAVATHHIYGFLFAVLLPPRLGACEVIDVRTLPPRALASRLGPGDLLVSHPAHLSLLARFGEALADDVVGVSSTAPCPDTLADELMTRGLSRLVQIYGSSETAGLGWRDAADQPYQLMPHWQRQSDAAGGHGCILQRRTPSGEFLRAHIQDELAWQADGRFAVIGRRDHAVQVAGVNVYPSRVAEVIASRPEVAACAVRLMTPAEGDRLKAYVVPATGVSPERLLPILEALMRERLTPPECPRAWTFGSRLPTGPQGKPADWPASGPAC